MGLESTTRMLAPFLDRLTDEELDAIPYGVVQLDAQGFVLSYNRAEMANALWNAQRPIGQDFFADIAPSARVPEIFGRFVDAFASQSCDDVFRFTYTCGDLPRTVRLRMYFSMRTDTIWLFTAAPDGAPLGNGAEYVDTLSIDRRRVVTM